MKKYNGIQIGLVSYSWDRHSGSNFRASVIEKHITLSREMYGSDAKNSLEPHEFKQLMKK